MVSIVLLDKRLQLKVIYFGLFQSGEMLACPDGTFAVTFILFIPL